MVSTFQNLFLDIQGDKQGTKPGGEPIHRIITLHNRGDRVAYLELWVEAGDQRSAGIVQWVTFDKSESELTLEPEQNLDVTLTITVPLQVEAGFYGYEILMRSSQYPGEEVRRNQQLHVLPSDQEARLRSEPRLTVTPVTDADHPHILKPGSTLGLSLTVDNPSRRTDRFFLHCDNLPPNWVTTQYPESDTTVPGIVTFTKGLQLNPRESGQITITIHPPQYSTAGSYYPTLRLTSKARPDIVLLRIVYFTLEPDEHLAIALTPKTLSIPRGNRYFDVVAHNQGNIERQLAFQGWDPDRRLHYRLKPAEIKLLPGQNAHLQLWVSPRHWWQKIWRLRNRTIEFDLLVENISNEAALPQSSPTGTVNLKAQRRWLFWLLLLSTTTTVLVGLLALVWYLFVWRPSLVPKIVNFRTTKESYQEGKPDPIAFSWEITNPEKVGQLVLTKDGVRVLELPRILGENVAAPSPMLEENASCSLEATINKNSPLTVLLRIYRRANKLNTTPKYLKCRAVIPADFLTDTFKFPGQEESVSEQEEAALESLNKPVEGNHEFKLQICMKETKQNNEDAPGCVDTQGKQNSKTDIQDEQNSEIDSKGIFSQLKQILGIENSKKQQLADKKILENVVVTAPDPPEILKFESTQSEYRTVSQLIVSATTAKASLGIPSTPSTISTVNPETDTTYSKTNLELLNTEFVDPQVIPIKLNWQITNPWDIKELRLTSLSPDGSENNEPITYSFVEILALVDSGFCKIGPDSSNEIAGSDILECENISTQATQVGDYVFYLTVITQDGTEATPILKTTPTISVKPPAPDIVNFAVNGESVKKTPRHVYVLNPARGKIDVKLSWDVQYAKNVELLPAPGKVLGNEITYTLSAAPGTETITLRGVNELDEEVTQSVIIEKVAFVSDAQSIPIQSSSRSSQSATETVTENRLPELPPPPEVLPVPDIVPIRTPPQAH